MCYTQTGFGIPSNSLSLSSSEDEWGPGMERVTDTHLEGTEKPASKTLNIDPELIDTFKRLMDGNKKSVDEVIGNQ